nr:MAG TPA: hypothetical protein [Caudoviricetes sp.]
MFYPNHSKLFHTISSISFLTTTICGIILIDS